MTQHFDRIYVFIYLSIFWRNLHFILRFWWKAYFFKFFWKNLLIGDLFIKTMFLAIFCRKFHFFTIFHIFYFFHDSLPKFMCLLRSSAHIPPIFWRLHSWSFDKICMYFLWYFCLNLRIFVIFCQNLNAFCDFVLKFECFC